MILLGTIVNTVAIVIGALAGTVLPRIGEGIRQTVMNAIGLAVAVLGIMMALKTENFLLVILSLVCGSLIGEWLRIEDRLNDLGKWLERKAGGKKERGNIATAFVTTTLLYCVGAMAILGSLDSGLRNNHDILYTKAMLDGFTAVIFASTLGIGVIFSAASVFLYQSAIVLSATFIVQFTSDEILQIIIRELTATGGILILAIGVNLLELKQIKIGNMLPALIIVSAAVPFIQWVKPWWEQVVLAMMG